MLNLIVQVNALLNKHSCIVIGKMIRGDRGWLMHFLVFLIYLVSGKANFDNYRV